MKAKILSALFAHGAILVAAPIQNQPLTTEFGGGLGYSVGLDDNLAGQHGWLINDPPGKAPAANLLSFFYNYNIVADSNNIWGALGGRWSTPNVGNPPGIDPTHPVSLPLRGATFSSDFALSHSQLPGTSRDKSGWSLLSGAAEIFRIAFEPDVNPAL